MKDGKHGVHWTEFDRRDRLVEKERFFATKAALNTFTDKVQQRPSFNAFTAFTSSEWPDEAEWLLTSALKKNKMVTQRMDTDSLRRHSDVTCEMLEWARDEATVGDYYNSDALVIVRVK